MSIGKDLFMAAHERLIEEYQERHPNASFGDASEATADQALDLAREDFADMIDAARDEAKYRSLDTKPR